MKQILRLAPTAHPDVLRPRDVVTRGEHHMTVRPIAPADAALLVAFFHRLSPETRWRRFLQPLPDMSDARLWPHAHRLAAIDRRREEALIATMIEGGAAHVVGVVRLARETATATTAEVALVVRDDCQGEGLGRILLAQLIQVARGRGLHGLWGLMAAENTAMGHLMHSCGEPVTTSIDHGEMKIAIALR
jgi:GNAT superfamily N-acetyltransferase